LQITGYSEPQLQKIFIELCIPLKVQMNKFSHNHYLKQATGKDSIVESIYSRGTTQQIPEPKKPFLPLNRGNSFFEQYFEQNPSWSQTTILTPQMRTILSQ